MKKEEQEIIQYTSTFTDKELRNDMVRESTKLIVQILQYLCKPNRLLAESYLRTISSTPYVCPSKRWNFRKQPTKNLQRTALGKGGVKSLWLQGNICGSNNEKYSRIFEETKMKKNTIKLSVHSKESWKRLFFFSFLLYFVLQLA